MENILHQVGRIFRWLGRCPSMAEPCVGVGGLRTWVQASGIPYQATACIDFDKDIALFYDSLKEKGEGGLDTVESGPVEGDMLSKPLDSLQPCEVFVAGPPCQPYAGNGKKMGFSDSRSEVLERCIDWIEDLAWKGELVAFLLENSERLAEHSEFWHLIERLTCSTPFFKIEVQAHDLSSLVPHSRPRLWVRGLRVDCLPQPEEGLPPPVSLESLGVKRFALQDFLEEGAPNLSPEQLTPIMRSNLSVYKRMAMEAIKDGVEAAVVACELDRNPLRAYGGTVVFDCVPSFRCGGPQIFLLSVDDISGPWEAQRLHRFLTVRERFALQGHPHALAEHFAGRTASMKASGNAFNVLAMAAMLAPLLESAARAGVLQRSSGSRKPLSEEELMGLVPSEGPPPKVSLKQAQACVATPARKRKRIS